MLTLAQLLKLDPRTADADVFAEWQPAALRARAEQAFNDCLQTSARNRALEARQTFGRHLHAIRDVSDERHDCDKAGERQRARLDACRTCLQAIQYFVALRHTSSKPANMWPAFPSLIPATPTPAFRPIGQPFNIAGWIKDHEDELLDTRRVRIVDGALCVRGFNEADMAVMRAHEGVIVGWLSAEFVSPQPPAGLVVLR